MRRLLVPITTAWSVRNVILSGLLDALAKRYDVVLAVPEDFPPFNLPEGIEFRRYQIPEPGHRPYLRIRERLGLAHAMRSAPRVADYGITLGKYRKSRYEQTVHEAKRWLAKWDAMDPVFAGLVAREREEWHRCLDAALVSEIESWGVQAAFFPVPHLRLEGGLARVVEFIGVPTSAFVLSFDNLSTKGRHPILFDRYMVWNRRMKDELLAVYPEVPEREVRVTGTPQFQFYFDESLAGSRRELGTAFDLDPSRPIVVFAAGPYSLVPHEVPVLARFLSDLRSADPAAQVVVRLHPIERNVERWEAIRNADPEVRWSTPWKTHATNKQWGSPEAGDIRALCLLMHHSDVVVNSASTMTLDALVCDTPAVCIDYTVQPYGDFGPHLHNFYDYAHYRPITASGAMRIARSPQELVGHVTAYRADRTLDREKRAQLVRDMVGEDPRGSVDRIAEAIGDLADSP